MKKDRKRNQSRKLGAAKKAKKKVTILGNVKMMKPQVGETKVRTEKLVRVYDIKASIESEIARGHKFAGRAEAVMQSRFKDPSCWHYYCHHTKCVEVPNYTETMKAYRVPGEDMIVEYGEKGALELLANPDIDHSIGYYYTFFEEDTLLIPESEVISLEQKKNEFCEAIQNKIAKMYKTAKAPF